MAILPPPEYDHPPTIPVIEQVLDKAEINKLCTKIGGPAPDKYSYEGCTYILKNISGNPVCLIFRISEETARRHEQAHCNGWKHENKPPFATIKPPIPITHTSNAPYSKPLPWPDPNSTVTINEIIQTPVSRDR